MSFLKITDLKSGEVLELIGEEPSEIKAVESWSIVDHERVRHVEIVGGYSTGIAMPRDEKKEKQFQIKILKICKQIKAAKCLI